MTSDFNILLDTHLINKKTSNLNTKNIINNTEIYDIHKLNKSLNNSLNISTEQDTILKNKLEIIEEKKIQLHNSFTHKNNLSKEYISQFYVHNQKIKHFNDNLNNIILDITKKNNEYNSQIDTILNEYLIKYNDSLNNNNNLYPKNYIIQICTNIILLQQNKFNMNILFKKALLQEINNNILENTEIHNNNDYNITANNILNECNNIYNMINTIEKDNNINQKESILQKITDNI